MLKSIELSGFKSFAKRSVIDIGAPTVAVVGPNGSGKSNAAEAFRFVLGEQSIKRMRGKKGEDLIWGGTDVVPRSNRASVRITFNNSNRLLDIDFDEVVIERIVHRDGTNEYAINGSRVRLKDVTALLAGANIGSSGHHIISQGEADRILNAGARERREMLEDALGLKVFQYKKVESEKKLAKTTENVKEIESAHRELAPQLKFLARQMQKRKRAEELRIELAGSLKLYLAQESHFIQTEDARTSKLKSGPEQELKNVESKISELQCERDGVDSSQNELTSKLLAEIENLDQDADSLSERESHLTRELGRLEGQLQLLERQNIERTNEVPTKVVQLSKVDKFAREVITESEIAENTREPDLLRNTLRHLRQLAKDFVVKIGGDEQTTSGTKTSVDAQLSELYSKKEQLEAELEDVVAKTKEQDLVRRTASERLSAEQSKGKDVELRIMELSAQKSELKSNLRDIQRLQEALSIVERAFEEELREAVVWLGRRAQDYESVDVASLPEVAREHQEQERRKLERMKIKLEEMGVVGDDVVEEYKRVSERTEFLEQELKDLSSSGESLLGLISELEVELATRFKNGLEKVNKEFQNFFSVLFDGGEAQLNLVEQKRRKMKDDLLEDVDEQDKVEEGVDVSVKLPRKKKTSLEILSGGERALTSIALIFAMSQVNPPPFIILDETDAALDEANSKRYADMVRVLSGKSQLIVITHNRETMAAAGELYGVTMGADGISRLLSVKLDEAVAVAK